MSLSRTNAGFVVSELFDPIGLHMRFSSPLRCRRLVPISLARALTFVELEATAAVALAVAANDRKNCRLSDANTENVEFLAAADIESHRRPWLLRRGLNDNCE